MGVKSMKKYDTYEFVAEYVIGLRAKLLSPRNKNIELTKVPPGGQT